MLSAIEPTGGAWKTLADRGEGRMLCRNAEFDACNWLTDPDTGEGYCRACRHNGTVPNLSDPAQLAGWRELEAAKHRLFYSLIRWRLPLTTRAEDPAQGLLFNFLADDLTAGQRIMTGHDNGLITIALEEADDIERERRRLEMGEPYRTLLGHFRHEVGHYFWDVLVRDGGRREQCRAVFGDDTVDDGPEPAGPFQVSGTPRETHGGGGFRPLPPAHFAVRRQDHGPSQRPQRPGKGPAQGPDLRKACSNAF
jgi:hypothetical protein